MQTAEYNYEDFQKGNAAADAKLAIRFFRKARQDNDASQVAGRPIFKEVDYIQVVVPGDRNQVVMRPISPGDKVRFQKQYEHWIKTQSNEIVSGTPLEAWNILSLSQIEEFRYFGVRTIEHMADLRDDVAQRIPGATQLKQKAAAFMAILKEEAPMKKVQAELDKRDRELDSLKQSVADQAAIIKELQKKAGKG